MNKTKVLLIAEFSKYGGTRTYFKQLLQYYHSRNYKVVVVINKKQLDSEIRNLIVDLRASFKIIPMLPENFIVNILKKIPFKLFFNLYYSFHIFPIILREKPDLITASIGTSLHFINIFILPYNIVYILHTYPSEKPLWINIFLKIYFDIFLKKGKILLTVSEFSQKRMQKNYLFKKNFEHIKYIYNYYGSRSTPIIRNDTKNNIVLTVGHVRHYKNPIFWIEVARKTLKQLSNDDLNFVWVGDGDMLSICQKMTADNSRINFVGLKDTEKIRDFYSAARLYLQPSRVENCGISVIQALQYKLPCVVSNVGGLPELIKSNENGFVVNLQQKELFIKKILYLVNNPSKMNVMAKKARALYEKKFCEEAWVLKMNELHKDLTKQ